MTNCPSCQDKGTLTAVNDAGEAICEVTCPKCQGLVQVGDHAPERANYAAVQAVVAREMADDYLPSPNPVFAPPDGRGDE